MILAVFNGLETIRENSSTQSFSLVLILVEFIVYNIKTRKSLLNLNLFGAFIKGCFRTMHV